MLKKLYRKFTLLNASVLILSLMIFSFTVYFFMNQVFKNTSYDFMIHFADQFKNSENIIREAKHRIPPKGKEIKDFDAPKTKLFKFFPKVDIILFDKNKSPVLLSDDFINPEEHPVILNFLPKSDGKDTFKKISINDVEYRVFSRMLVRKNETVYLQIFHNKEFENAFLYNLFIMLMIIGLISVIILIAISQWLAKKSLVPVKAAWEQQREFVANASHELRTPLTVIQTNLEAALYDPDALIKDNKMWLENAFGETQSMSNLINELLLLAKIDAKQIKLKKEIFDLSQLAYNVSDKMLPIIEKNHLKFDKNIHDNILFYGDIAKIRQLLLILLDNAIKYNKKYGSIFLEVFKEGDNIVVAVKDTGIGIQNKERIFDRFYMEDKARSREKGGFGLGLNIANWIVENHNGVIELETNIGEGSTFKVYFK